MSPDRLLRVVSPYFVAGAIFTRLPSGWSCIHAAPILRWMLGKQPRQIKRTLTERGFQYEWLNTASDEHRLPALRS